MLLLMEGQSLHTPSAPLAKAFCDLPQAMRPMQAKLAATEGSTLLSKADSSVFVLWPVAASCRWPTPVELQLV